MSQHLMLNGPLDGQMVELGPFSGHVLLHDPAYPEGSYVRTTMSPTVVVFRWVTTPPSRWEKRTKAVDWDLDKAARTRVAWPTQTA